MRKLGIVPHWHMTSDLFSSIFPGSGPSLLSKLLSIEVRDLGVALQYRDARGPVNGQAP